MKKCVSCGASYSTSRGHYECPDCYRIKKADKKAEFAASQQRKQESWEADLAGMESEAQREVEFQGAVRQHKAEQKESALAAEGARLAALMPGAMTSALPTLKACPDCGEDVKFIARKCKHCSFVFENAQAEVEAAQEEADKATAEATANGIRQLGEESSSALGFAMRVAVAQSPNPAGTGGFAHCAMFAKREFRLEHRQMAEKAMFDDAIRTRWNKQDNETKGSVEQLLNAATVVVKAKIQVGEEHSHPNGRGGWHVPGKGFNLGLRMEPKPLGLLVRSGSRPDWQGNLSMGQGDSGDFFTFTLQHIMGGDGQLRGGSRERSQIAVIALRAVLDRSDGHYDEWIQATQNPNKYVFNCPEIVRTQTGSKARIAVDHESAAQAAPSIPGLWVTDPEHKSAGEPLDIQLEFLIEPGELKVTPGLMAGVGRLHGEADLVRAEAWASAEPFVLSSNDVLVLELAWQIKAGGFLSAEQITGYKIINATKYSSNRSNHMGRWGNRLEHGFSETASTFHQDAIFDERDKQLQMLECLDLLWNDEFPEEALGKGEVILGDKGALSAEIAKLKAGLATAVLAVEGDAGTVIAEIHEKRQALARGIEDATSHRDVAKAIAVEWNAANTAVKQAESTLITRNKEVLKFTNALGTAVIAGWVAGQVPFTDELTPVKALQEECVRLRERIASLREVKGFFAAAKAKAEQIAAQAQLSIAEGKIKSGASDVGRAFIDANTEESVRCESTAAVLDEIAQVRTVLAELVQAVADAKASREAEVPNWMSRLSVESMDQAVVNGELSSREQAIKAARVALSTFENREVIERILAATDGLPGDDHPIGQLIATLRDKETDLSTMM